MAKQLKDFNPRTREGCDSIALGEAFADDVISIHAPVKGATSPSDLHAEGGIDISIHAPVKGATL